jgi:hypothetical protein
MRSGAVPRRALRSSRGLESRRRGTGRTGLGASSPELWARRCGLGRGRKQGPGAAAAAEERQRITLGEGVIRVLQLLPGPTRPANHQLAFVFYNLTSMGVSHGTTCSKDEGIFPRHFDSPSTGQSVLTRVCQPLTSGRAPCIS